MLEDEHRQRDAAGRLASSFLSFFRRLDQQEMAYARAACARGVSGSPARPFRRHRRPDRGRTEAQFEVLAEILADSGMEPSEVTLAAGNHGVTATPTPRTCTARSAQGVRGDQPSGRDHGLDDLVVVPVSTVIKQPISRSAGVMPLEHCTGSSRRDTMKGTGPRSRVASITAIRSWVRSDELDRRPAEPRSEVDLLQRHAELARVARPSPSRQQRSRGRSRIDTARRFGTTACVDHECRLNALYEAATGASAGPPTGVAGRAAPAPTSPSMLTAPGMVRRIRLSGRGPLLRFLCLRLPDLRARGD